MSENQRVALTFDAEHPDRPGTVPGTAERILDILAGARTTATFFVQGRWSQAEPRVARRIADEGHLVGNHSHYHARMPLLSDRGIEADVRDADAAVREATGTPTAPWFRCPFGDGHDDPRVLRVLRDLGYRNVHWHIEIQDWERWRTAGAIAEDALSGVGRQGDGAVVLLHTWPTRTADALPEILDRLRERGTELVRLDQLPEEGLP